MGISIDSVRRLRRPNSRGYDPTFPTPIWVTDSTPRFFLHEFRQWLASRPRGGAAPSWTKTGIVKVQALCRGRPVGTVFIDRSVQCLKVQWGPHAERHRTKTWGDPRTWAKEANGSRPRVFCASLSDWLDNQMPQQWRTDLAEPIEATPELDWLLLTKRIENFRRLSPWRVVPDHVWLGVTAEDQQHFDRRWAVLAAIPAKVRFVSYEPALGPLSIADRVLLPDWIICGGESGPHRRPIAAGMGSRHPRPLYSGKNSVLF